jgi:hypothetical protein
MSYPNRKENYVRLFEINITGTLPSDELPIFLLKPGDQETCVYIMID